MLSETLSLTAGITEQSIQFTVDGQCLYGNMIRTESAKKTGIVFLHGWGGVRSGPHNIISYYARELAKEGYASIRFDFRGRGESDGDPSLGVQDTMLNMGDDAVAAAKLLMEECAVDKLVFFGICSGGNVGIGILDQLDSVKGLFLLSVYPFGDADDFSREARRSMNFFKEYCRKLFLASTWKRFFKGEIDFGSISKILLKPFAKKPESDEKPSSNKNPKETGKGPLENLLLNKPELLMIYGDADPEFQSSIDYYRAFTDKTNYPVHYEIIEAANHNFYAIEWKDAILAKLKKHLETIS
ncbi:MAG: alpha/beta fold hydrolase [Lentisphaeria bacterium]|nr:alpha/beta hydrolase [Lentisphaeria bacterium]NQZ70294.1 alpha/beta fold hydrolase [Lentisphaeria bacterium]